MTPSTVEPSETKQERKKRTDRERKREWRKANPELSRAAVRRWHSQHRDEQKDYQRGYREQNKEKLREYRQLKKFGLSFEQSDALFKAQGSVCAVCRSDEHGNVKTGWHVDHDHATGSVRGILCHHCNLMLGNARDNPANLSAAISYLERTRNGGEEETAGRR